MLYMDYFDRGVAQFPDRVFVQDDDLSVSYRKAGDDVDRLASWLIAAGLSPGDRAATYAFNSSRNLMSKYAIIRAGGVWVPINFRYTAQQVADHLNAYDVETLIFDEQLLDQVTALRDICPGLKRFICLGESQSFAPSFEDCVQAGKTPARFPHREMTDPVVMLSTSGTTGHPKGVLLSNRSVATVIASHQITMPFDAPPVHLVAAPMSHAAGVFASSILSIGGSNQILPAPDPLLIMQSIEACRANVIFLPPTLIYMMLSHPRVREFDYSSLKYILYGGAPMSVHKLREALDVFGPVLSQGYGQSEVPNCISFFSPRDHCDAVASPGLEHRIASAGRPGPMCRVEIMTDDGVILPPGETGEIVCRSDLLMNEYYRNEEETAAVSSFGWHHTGDIGRKDEDGFLYIVDRKKDLIISGGFNVFPAEVEQVLLAHPAVQDCAVIGVPDEKWGEAVVAAIELKSGQTAVADEIISSCRGVLGGIKTPKRIDFWAELPRSPVGKILRREVRRTYWEGHDREI